MKLLRHIASYGGLYLIAAFFYVFLFWFAPLSTPEFGRRGVMILHASTLLFAWGIYGYLRLPDGEPSSRGRGPKPTPPMVAKNPKS